MEKVHMDVADAEALEALLPDLHQGLAPERPFDGYRTFFLESNDHRWARENARGLVLRSDDGAYLSYLRLFAARALHRDREVWLGGISSVVTPAPHRRKGYATELLKLTLELLTQDGIDGAYLFSDIGAILYERLGFAAVGSSMVDVPLSSLAAQSAPASVVRPLEVADWASVRKMHYRAGAGQPLWFLRDEGQWDFLLSRWTRRAAHYPGDKTKLISRVLIHADEIIAYAIARIRGDVLKLLEYGMEAPNETMLAILLGSLRDEAMVAGCTRFTSPWPPGIWGPPFATRFVPVPRPDGLFMVASLSPEFDLAAIVEQMQGYWETDHI